MKILQQFSNLSQSNYFSGVVDIDANACTACEQCVRICPSSALKLVGKKGVDRRSAMVAGADCLSCAACCAVCEAQAIKISRFWRVPDGAYRTLGRNQKLGRESYPRIFTSRENYEK